ncbi:leucine-rich repeat and immunoglobulin-like domain-containing nogo receptor-interacting protein 3 [Chiloscyllium plagiosum]|uniref:leucine-rich repeat and immunoglobulin-like domain-containing nogo receptor-interacting protein 3 n=1 Tax=Chiloscyllium plagiosum TaxID=36176 RepID=UPI001CB82403|nr:leucine-rich repeat and immunoglobulin-like domain-containing nogo receptor-interacting protein 3 [Chiloscyllium plagiosum]
MLSAAGARARAGWRPLFLLLLLVLPEPGRSCPSPCRCWPDNRTVECSGRGLESVPAGIPGGTRVLDLSRNRLRRLEWPRGAGPTVRRRLEELDLSGNLVSELPGGDGDGEEEEEAEGGGAWSGLGQLRRLRLDRNRLRYLSPGALGRMAALESLQLGSNPLPALLDLTFRGLRRLGRLEVGGPQLGYLGPRLWEGLPALRLLTVTGGSLPAAPSALSLQPLANLSALRLLGLARVRRLPAGTFGPLAALRLLQLDGWSSLSELEEGSLRGPELLLRLSVTRCNLSSVPYRGLQSQPALRWLDLSHNPIRVIRAGMLRHVTRLEELRLVGAGLLAVQPEAFRGLLYFRLLDVTSNQLRSLPEKAFRSAAGLHSLGLGDNPLACDCRLHWVARRRRRLRFLGPAPACRTPEAQRGLRLDRPPPPGSFLCSRPRIRDKRPQRLSVREGRPVTLRCSADGNPPPDILWLNPRRQRLGAPTPGPFPLAGPALGRSRLLPDGSLEIASVRPQDAGIYRCVARNAGGNDTAAATLRVRPLSPQELGVFRPAGRGGPRPGYPFDTQTLLVTTTMGFASFFSVVTVCFSLLFAWSRAKGPIRHNNIQVDFVPHGGGGGGGGGAGEGEDAKYNMKMV